MQINVLQCRSGRDFDENLAFLREQFEMLPQVEHEQQLVVLPECVLLFGGHESLQIRALGEGNENPFTQALAELASQYQVYLVAGTVPELSQDGRFYSRCYVFDPQGQVMGQYDKLHLFDVDVADGTKQYRESETFCPGEHVAVVDTPLGKIGLAICYDLRFPELFQAMREQGAEIIALPAAFTKVTGKAHWQTLLQARAIETQTYVVAAAQWGQHPTSRRETWGHSMIVNPWGEIMAEKPSDIGWVQAKPDFAKMNRIRNEMPVLEHKRFQSAVLK
ncbi:carbon-nitrogen hydrolase family protein [Parashewanella curva]|uniref:Carbon-nitrogen hydrolase family protein n=1 Tax=Parashewanella curva TaxID=2338552 RepID=A0A3L8PUN5_9GAMM|nr:carbon-nitrogen hydrolase family protein [Parashewanella curva]RLV59026.1 carbon-nitrogen hydrolase family protein [Parashewanella curva]